MTDTPKLYPYIVAISFAEGGPLYINAILACNEALATAAVTAEFFQNAGTSKPLMGVSVAQLVPEFLRTALRARGASRVPWHLCGQSPRRRCADETARRRCTPPPPAADAARYELVGDPGKARAGLAG